MLRPLQDNRNCIRHFAIIYINRDGQLRHDTSSSISNDVQAVLSPELTREFLRAVADSRNNGFTADLRAGSPERTWPALAVPKASLGHRKKLCVERPGPPIDKVAIPIKDKDLLRQYYVKVFQNLQQTNCRIIAKAWVKLVEPHKQIHYPYNGRKVVAGKTIQLSSIETQPPWWPPGVRHHGPDHLLKAGKRLKNAHVLHAIKFRLERIALLLHILCELRTSHGITAQKLKHAGQLCRRSMSPVDRSELLDELCDVREKEEYHIDGATGMYARADTVCANQNVDDSTNVYISHTNQPSPVAVTCSRTSQDMKTPQITPSYGHESHVQHATMPFQPDQKVVLFNQHVNSEDLMDVSHQQSFFMQPIQSAPATAFLNGLQWDFSSIDMGLCTTSSSDENCSTSIVSSHL